MSFLFGSKPLAPAPLPVSPNSAEQEAARVKAETEAIAGQKLRGRASTIVAGMGIEEAESKGNFAPKRRAAARELG